MTISELTLAQLSAQLEGLDWRRVHEARRTRVPAQAGCRRIWSDPIMAMTADQLPDDPDALKAMVPARDVENARLIQIIKELQRHRFGRRAETLPADRGGR